MGTAPSAPAAGTPEAIASKLLGGCAVSGARAIRWLEDGDRRGVDVLQRIYPESGKAHLVGITGPPGAGKSTLVDALVAELRKRDRRVAVIAIDPSSPFSGGALLGDRVRMQRHATDPGVFIRSMATRGQLGGLSRATFEATAVLDAMGFDLVLIETVGVGQDELEVVELAHTTLVVNVPGLGDDIQALKAGILEVGDLFVLNKADRPGADETEKQLRLMLHMNASAADASDAAAWEPPLLRTVAAREEGIEALADACERHREHLHEHALLDEAAAARSEHFFRELLRERASAKLLDAAAQSDRYANLIGDVRARKIDPYSAAEALTAQLRPAFDDAEEGAP